LIFFRVETLDLSERGPRRVEDETALGALTQMMLCINRSNRICAAKIAAADNL
jgi:hypothetical protein